MPTERPPDIAIAVAPRDFAWMTRRATILLILAILFLRIAYLLFLCRYELLADEALYWDCSRRPDLCYYEKGPITPLLIAAATRLFGHTEWAVRLPMAVCSALAALALAEFARCCSRGDARIGFLAAVLFSLMPAFQANAQIATPDGSLIAAWILGVWAAWVLLARVEVGVDRLRHWAALGAALGVGVLCKQSMLLLIPGLLLYIFLRRAAIPWHIRLAPRIAWSVTVFSVLISPMILWNIQHDWPTVRHTLEHVLRNPLPGSMSAPPPRTGYDPLWTIGLIAAQIGAFGPAAILLIILAVRWSIRTRESQPHEWPARLWILCASGSALAVYAAVTFWKRAEANWPFHAFSALLVPVAQMAIVELSRHRALVAAWLAISGRPRPHQGFLRRRPETMFQVCWDWVGIYGVAGWLLIAFLPNVLSTLGGARLTERFHGHRERAERLQILRTDLISRTQREPLLVGHHYSSAALNAFYLADHPIVYNASSRLGGRRSSYDFWPETDLAAPELRGRDLILLGASPRTWSALCFNQISMLENGIPAWLGAGYCGGSASSPSSDASPAAPPPRK